MRYAISTLLSVVWMIIILTTTSFAQDNSKIWSLVLVNQTEPGTDDLYYKWDPPASITKFFLFDRISATIEPNFRPFPNAGSTQSELSVDVAPFDENIVFASSNAASNPYVGFYGTGVYWTLDGGITWGGNDIPPFGSNSGDPASVIGNNGYFYENFITNSYGQGISVSTDNGATWSNHIVAPNPGSLADKNHMMIDKTPGSPYENRLYVAWTDFGGVNNNDVVVRYSTNFGVNWSSSKNISNSLNAGSHSQGVNLQTASNGDVYAAFAVYDAWPGGEDAIGFAKSTDGGATWTSSRIYSAVNFGIRGELKPTFIRVASFPSMAVDRSGGAYDGTIYITWPQRNVSPAGSDPDIVMIKSTDGGSTWSSPVRVNDDVLNNGKDQYYPWCTVDQSTGQLLFVFYDSRNVNNDSSSVWMASSYDGGSTFNNFEVSEQPFKPKSIAGLATGYQGDYIGIAALNDVAYPYWMDDRTGNYQGWMSIVRFGPPCPIDAPSNPNPANGAIDVPIALSQLSWDNGAGANQNELWFGEAGSMQLVHSGSLVNFWVLPGQLTYSTSYQWRVVEWNDTCYINGPVWAFTTQPDPNIIIDTLFFDDFESGLDLWTVTNNGGTCNWLIFNPPYPNSYTLPATSSGGVLAGDSDECGSGTTLLSSAKINATFDFSGYNTMVWIEFDNDWNVINSQDEAHVELSTDGGATWAGVWDQVGVDIRNTHEVIDITTAVSGQNAIQIRVRTVQPGWDWWWTLDNFAVYGMSIVPVELTSFVANVTNDNVKLNWSTATELNNQGFEVQKKSGEGLYQKVGFVPGFGTTTEIKSYSFVDSKVATGNYTYRLKQMDYDGSFEYSNEVNIEVSVPLRFALEQNYPNPFNPSTVINYSIPETGFVTLEVFNLLGERVTSLVNKIQEAGRYEINFDASKLVSGIYIYNLISGNFNSAKKMLIMK